MPSPLPMIDGIKPSYLHLPCDKSLNGTPLLDFLCRRFPFVPRLIWLQRLDGGFVVAGDGSPLPPDAPFRAGETVYYYREAITRDEIPVPFRERVLYADDDLIAVDKPHFLPVVPGGRFLRETLLTRLRLHPGLQHLDTGELAPVHRLDKDTAGVVLFTCRPQARAAYQGLFERRAVRKTYLALAPTRSDLAYPLSVRSRLIRSGVFYLMCEAEGPANAHTVVELLENRGAHSLYRLLPETGKKHQLRVHMAALGMPLLNDPLYPEALPDGPPDYGRPLQLLAKSLEFRDPFSGRMRRFESPRCL
ncbi:MAG: pseudouridine synthase [Neisseria sp.]|nr:pseudouridine synthase [Neisseria sp.]